MLKWRKPAPTPAVRAGLQMDGQGVTLATVDEGRVARVGRVACGREGWRQGVDLLCRQLGVAKAAPVALVLPPDAYNLLLIEPPDVPDGEMKEAVRWRNRELLSFPAEEAAIDVFRFPEDAQRGRRTVFVAAAHRTALSERIAAVLPTRLQVVAIDITELSVRNLTELAGAAPLAILQAADGVGAITLVRGGDVYLSRRIELSELDAERTIDQALLQLQRSLDYFENQLGQGLASGVLVALPAEVESAWMRRLQEMLPLPVHALSRWVEQTLGFRDIPSTTAAALGGALRAPS